MTSSVLVPAAAILVLLAAAAILIIPQVCRRNHPEQGARPARPAVPSSNQAVRASGPGPAGSSSGSSGGLDLSLLPPAPSPGGAVPERFLSESRMQEVRVLAGQVSQQIQARQGLIDALSDSPEDPGELTRAVTQDPALAGQILKTVNSPIYGLREPLASIFRAVLYLGHLEVRNIIWKVCFADAIWMTPSPEDSAMLDNFWAHSFQTSRMAYAAAKTLQLADPDVFATSALLHDIGKLLAWQLWPDKARPVYESMGFSDSGQLDREWNELEIDHNILGAETAAIWRLPHDVRMAMEHHHAPSYRGPDLFGSAARPVMAVHLADLLSHLPKAQAGAGAVLPYRPQDGWWDVLGVTDPGALCSTILRKAAVPGQGNRQGSTRAA